MLDNLSSELPKERMPMTHVKERDFAWIEISSVARRSVETVSMSNPFTICARVLFPSVTLKNTVNMNALTAVGLQSQGHSAFFLGARQVEESYHWTVMLSPEITSENGGLECIVLPSVSPIDAQDFDQWVWLSFVFCPKSRKISLYSQGQIPVTVDIPDGFPIWSTSGVLLSGHGIWDDNAVDLWPGRVSQIRVFEKVLSEDDLLLLTQNKK